MEKKYLIILTLVLCLMYSYELIEKTNPILTGQYLLGVLFLCSAIISAFFINKWFGKLLLVIYFIFNGLVPMLLGLLSTKFKSTAIKRSIVFLSASTPFLMLLFSYISYSQGNVEGEWQPTVSVFLATILHSIFWLFSCLYFQQIFLLTNLNKIKKHNKAFERTR